MQQIPILGRSLAVAGLLLGVLATIATPGVSAQADDVTLTIHVLTCPTDATGDIFDACHDNRVEGANFDVGGTAAESDDEGVVSATVAAGSVAIEELDFATLATAGKAYVHCSVQPGGSPVLIARNTTVGKVTIQIAADTDEVHCDWYNRTGPTAKKIWIHALECPVDATGDIFEACHDNRLEDVEFKIGDTTATSDDEGVATFNNPPAGEITLEEIDFDDLATAGKAFVHCSVQPGGSPVLTEGNTTDGDVTFDVPSNAEVHCDWYNRTSATGPTPTSEATEEPTEEPTETEEPEETETAEATATSSTSLPDTGIGPAGGSSGAGLAFGLGLIVVAVAGAAYGLRRKTA